MVRTKVLCERIDLYQGERLVLAMLVDLAHETRLDSSADAPSLFMVLAEALGREDSLWLKNDPRKADHCKFDLPRLSHMFSHSLVYSYA